MGKRILRLFGAAAISGAAFWGPDVVWHLVRGDEFGDSWLDMVGLTAATLLACLAAYRAMLRTEWPGANALALSFVVGMWALGPLYMGAMWMDGLCPCYCEDVILLPVCTFIMSTYDGSLGSLSLATVGVLLCSSRGPTQHRVPVSPGA